MSDSHNNINVLQRSPIFTRLAEVQGPQVNYSINCNDYSMGYYLADRIYPSWAIFVKTIPEPQGNKKKYFTKAQEACRNDVERVFGVLQSRFAIVHRTACLWDDKSLGNIMMAYITMHNMIVEDERDKEADLNYDEMGEKVTVSHDDAPNLMPLLLITRRSRTTKHIFNFKRIWWSTCGIIIRIYTMSDFILCCVISCNNDIFGYANIIFIVGVIMRLISSGLFPSCSAM
jgi:hypothetical protein